MNAKRQITATLVFVVSLLMSGCGAGQLFGSTLTPIPTLTSTPTLPASTPTLTPDPKVLTLKATGDLLNLLDTWDGKYVLFVNKNTDIKTLEDLNEKKHIL
jgi:hypothetical protein